MKFLSKLFVIGATAAAIAVPAVAASAATVNGSPVHSPQPSCYQGDGHVTPFSLSDYGPTLFNQYFGQYGYGPDCGDPNCQFGKYQPGSYGSYGSQCNCGPVFTPLTSNKNGGTCRPVNPGGPIKTCTPVVFTNSSTGTYSVTEGPGGPKLTNGEEVVYKAASPVQDYTVTDVYTRYGVTTYELEGPLPGHEVHLEGDANGWDLTTVCPAAYSGGSGSKGHGHNHNHK